MPKLIGITKKWGNRSIFNDFSYEFKPQKTTVILGKSGVGKTTLLSIIAGTTDYEGKTEGFGKIGYVFQTPRLIPFMTVKENLQYALSSVYDKKTCDEKAEAFFRFADIIPLKNKLAKNLSGGEMQRVSLIRAFLYSSETILSDEPFSSLDIGLKMKIIDLYRDLSQKNPKTSILVTHDIDEALYLADEILFISENGHKTFYVETKKEDRKYGYEKNNALRAELYELFLQNPSV